MWQQEVVGWMFGSYFVYLVEVSLGPLHNGDQLVCGICQSHCLYWFVLWTDQCQISTNLSYQQWKQHDQCRPNCVLL